MKRLKWKCKACGRGGLTRVFDADTTWAQMKELLIGAHSDVSPDCKWRAANLEFDFVRVQG